MDFLGSCVHGHVGGMGCTWEGVGTCPAQGVPVVYLLCQPLAPRHSLLHHYLPSPSLSLPPPSLSLPLPLSLSLPPPYILTPPPPTHLQDDDLMLASFKPTSWQLYSPCGLPGQYRPLRHVNPAAWAAAAAAAATSAAQQQAPPCVTGAASQHQQHLCPELLSLQACRAATRHMQGGDAVRGNGSRALEAWRSKSSGMEGCGGRLAECAAGAGPWYCPYEDCLLGVWEWDSAETPLVVQPGG